MRIGITGAGIGGLTAAIALSRAGHDVSVFEQARELGEVGAGIQLSPNATRVLDHLGVLRGVEQVAVRPATGDLHRWNDGSIIVSQPLGDTVREQYGFPYLHVHRADLHGVLAGAATDAEVHLDHRLTGLDQDVDGVSLQFGDIDQTSEVDIAIGADGIHSEIRRQLFGEERPRFSGNTAWRGLVDAGDVAHLELSVSSHAFLGPGRHFVTYYVGAGRYVNWVGVAPSETWTLESWNAPGELDDALADFDGWCDTVTGLIKAARDQSLFRWALYDRDPLNTWTEGRVTLLGDACHPMLPFMAQGAGQAIEDAMVLTGCLTPDTDGDPNAALVRYEQLRKERTARVQLGARANETMFHLPDGPEQEERDARLGSAESRRSHRNSWLFSYDATTAATESPEGTA